MARTQNKHAYAEAKLKMVIQGEALFRSMSYSSVGINEILKACNVPRGSFYHYFESKQSFALAVLEHYHAGQMDYARLVLRDEKRKPSLRLKAFFNGAKKEFETRKYADGCLMCNLSAEVADNDEEFRQALATCWTELSREIAACVKLLAPGDVALPRLSSKDTADWLLNAWCGALSRMKVEKSVRPLTLFEKTIFPSKKDI